MILSFLIILFWWLIPDIIIGVSIVLKRDYVDNNPVIIDWFDDFWIIKVLPFIAPWVLLILLCMSRKKYMDNIKMPTPSPGKLCSDYTDFNDKIKDRLGE